MPGPAAPVVAGIWLWRAWRTYEAAMTAAELAQMAAEISNRKREALRVLRETIEKLSQEIDIKSSTYAAVDRGGHSTVSRRGGEGATFSEYIERKIPFRPAISTVCKMALAIPIQVPRRIRRKLPGEMVETSIEVLLKQTTASLMFEGVDDALEWKSPLKTEPTYDLGSRRAHLGSPSTRPGRMGSVFPFWPRPRGSVSPDLVIVEYRQQPFEVANVFAAVELKFPGDWVKAEQLGDYSRLMGRTDKVALMRIPEDCTDVTPGADRDGTTRRAPVRGGRR